MPISGGKYVAPTWVNSTSPPIDADELQDICDSIEAYADPASVVPTIPNPNLLDNWYFVGGGSQQGGGQFPINQRGATSYTGDTYSIDRWKLPDTNTTLTLATSGLTVTRTSSAAQSCFNQFHDLSFWARLAGKVVTLSALTTDGALSSVTDTLPTNLNTTWDTIHVSVSTAFWMDIFGDPSNNSCRVRLYNTNTGSVSLAAMKLELGDTQTLAHQENGVWVLNEIPNYDIQFARCSELPSVPARYESGTYVGTGTIGSSNPNTLTFGFKPKYVMVTGTSVSGTLSAQFVSGMTTVVTRSSTNYTYQVTWGDTSISWYYSGTNTSYAWRQMNSSGVTYYYIAIG